MLSKTRTRARQLTTKFLSSPLLPVLGWTKVVESVVASGPVHNWVVYAVAVTVLWIFADTIQEWSDQVTDQVEDEYDDVTGGDNGAGG